MVKYEGGSSCGHFGKAVFVGTRIIYWNAIEHDHTVNSAALQNCFFLLSNHSDLGISYFAFRYPDLHNTVPVKVTFMLSVELHNYKTMKTNGLKEPPEDSLDTCLLIQNQTNGTFMKR